MVVYQNFLFYIVKVQSEFSVDTTIKNNILLDNH